MIALARPAPAPAPADERKLFRVRELCVRWGLSRSMVYQMLDAGTIHSVHIGKSRRVPLEAVEQFEATLLTQGAV